VVIHLKVDFDNLGVSHLADELEAAEKELRTQNEEGAPPGKEGAPRPAEFFPRAGPMKWAHQDLNPGHCGYEPRALTN
jgi:hypothetical protein